MGRVYSDCGVRLSRGSGGLAMPLAVHGQCHLEMIAIWAGPVVGSRRVRHIVGSATRCRASNDQTIHLVTTPAQTPAVDLSIRSRSELAWGRAGPSRRRSMRADTFGVLRNSEFVGQTTSKGACHRTPVASDGPPAVRPARAGDRRPVGDAPAVSSGATDRTRIEMDLDGARWGVWAARSGPPRNGACALADLSAPSLAAGCDGTGELTRSAPRRPEARVRDRGSRVRHRQRRFDAMLRSEFAT